MKNKMYLGERKLLTCARVQRNSVLVESTNRTMLVSEANNECCLLLPTKEWGTISFSLSNIGIILSCLDYIGRSTKFKKTKISIIELYVKHQKLDIQGCEK